MHLKDLYSSIIHGFNNDQMCRTFEMSAMDLNGGGNFEFQIKNDDRTYYYDKPELRLFARKHDLLRTNKQGGLMVRLPVELFNVKESPQTKLF